MKKRIKLKGRIKTYLQFSIYLGVLLLVINAGMLALDLRAGLLLGFLCLMNYFFVFGVRRDFRAKARIRGHDVCVYCPCKG